VKEILYDSAVMGHHSEYISHIVEYLSDNATDKQYYFVVSEELPAKFPDIVKKSESISNIHWVFIPLLEISKLYSQNIITRSFSELKLVSRYAKELKAQHVHLLYFNIFQLALGFIRPKFTISGILFLQFYRMSTKSFRERVKYYRKYMTTKLYVRNSKLKKIFLLNDDKTVKYLNKEFKTDKFRMLPDPIPALTPAEGFDLRQHYKIEESRKVLLHIGSLGDRKGTFEIIESAALIAEELQSQICILLVGKAGNLETEKQIADGINKVSAKTKVKILWDNQFVPNDVMKSLFNQSDVVLMPYKNAEASSGILGHAMDSKTPVIATGSGLLKDIVLGYGAGALIDKVTEASIADAIGTINLSEYNATAVERFVQEHSSQRFVRTILAFQKF